MTYTPVDCGVNREELVPVECIDEFVKYADASQLMPVLVPPLATASVLSIVTRRASGGGVTGRTENVDPAHCNVANVLAPVMFTLCVIVPNSAFSTAATSS